MTEQQWRVIADRDKGDDMVPPRDGDRVTYGRDGWGKVIGIRIERPVPSTGLPAPMHLTDAEADSFHAAMQEPRVPTREQIARVMADIDARNFPLTAHYEYADAVLALIQNGADR